MPPPIHAGELASRTQSTSSSRSRSKSEGSPSTYAPRRPRWTDSSATPIAPRWTQTASHSSRETGMTASEAAPTRYSPQGLACSGADETIPRAGGPNCPPATNLPRCCGQDRRAISARCTPSQPGTHHAHPINKSRPRPTNELRPETWTRLMVAVMRLPVGPDPGILPGSGP